MKIENKSRRRTVPIDQVQVGGLFWWEGTLYLRVDPGSAGQARPNLSVDLQRNAVVYFHNDSSVEVVSGKVVLE